MKCFLGMVLLFYRVGRTMDSAQKNLHQLNNIVCRPPSHGDQGCLAVHDSQKVEFIYVGFPCRHLDLVY